MSTRGAIGFKLDQKEVLFYNHSDSYPDWLGVEMVKYCNNITDLNSLREKVVAFQLIDKGDIPTLEQKSTAYALGTVNLNVSNQTDDDFYCLTRNAQGDLDLMLSLGFGELANDFVYDSLFCEYAYIINLDTEELEFYEGFNTDRNAEGRYAKGSEPTGNRTDEYGGVKLVGVAPLNAIPDDWQERFYPEEESDDE